MNLTHIRYIGSHVAALTGQTKTFTTVGRIGTTVYTANSYLGHDPRSSVAKCLISAKRTVDPILLFDPFIVQCSPDSKHTDRCSKAFNMDCILDMEMTSNLLCTGSNFYACSILSINKCCMILRFLKGLIRNVIIRYRLTFFYLDFLRKGGIKSQKKSVQKV